MKAVALSQRTSADIEAQVAKILRGVGNPEPPIDLLHVRELLRLDRAYYSTSEKGFLRETVSRLTIAGRQVLERPLLLAEAVRKLSLKALYLPDQKRILLDRDVPVIKHRWNEAHEIGHNIIPWHASLALGDTEQTLKPFCHEQIESEANYAAGQILFLGERFVREASDTAPTLDHIRQLSVLFGNTITSTLWRFVEQEPSGRPLIGLVTGHPHPSRRSAGFDPTRPCRYFVRSSGFVTSFAKQTESSVFEVVARYCGAQRGGELGRAEVVLPDDNGVDHEFRFETFFNRYDALTLGVWMKKRQRIVSLAF